MDHKKLKVSAEYSSVFHNPRWLNQIVITGTRIRKPGFMKLLGKFMKDIKKLS